MKSVLKKYEVLNDKEENLRYSWNAFAVHLDKPRALWFAYNGQKFLDGQVFESGDEKELLDKMYRKGMGYHIVAMSYLWNEWFEEAFALEQYFLSDTAFWIPFKENIGFYLEMLIAKEQTLHLNKLFDDLDFKYAFLPWYEVFISLLSDPEYRITKIDLFVPIVNRVNMVKRTYR